MLNRLFLGLPLLAVLLFQPLALQADVRMPALFGDHMVLQRDQKIPIWGWAEAGEKVTVTLGMDEGSATTDASGRWRVDLLALPSSTAPLTLTVKGKNNLSFTDVLVGEVWICSGQSNMEFATNRAHNAATGMPLAKDEQLRFFRVPRKVADEPQTDAPGKWEVCSPETVADFSAVGYFFGRELRQTLHRPVGLIGTYWGGMPAQAFTSLSGLQKDPPFQAFVDAFDAVVKNYPTAKAEFPKVQAEYNARLNEWKAGPGQGFDEKVAQWKLVARQAKAAGQVLPPRPVPAVPMPQPPAPPVGKPNTPTVLYNGMIAPLIPYGIRGVIWYQGEANADNGGQYATLFPRMISDWREKWNQGDFPFLYVQLANYRAPQVNPSEGGWALLREAQLKTLSLPRTGMASAIDIGNGADIHPTDKLDVGLRLALAAKHVAYGLEVVYSGPLYDAMTVEGSKVRLKFKETGSGLQMGTPPWTSTGVPVPSPTELVGFAIAAADKNWVWAEAKIDGDTVVVSSDKVSAPLAVRYAWASNPKGNLYNKEGLPASSFRTDKWVDEPTVVPAAPSTRIPASNP